MLHMKLCYNVVQETYSKIIILGTMIWPYYIENCTVRGYIMRLNYIGQEIETNILSKSVKYTKFSIRNFHF